MKFIGVLLILVPVAITSSKLQGRITKGNSATLGQFPYQVGLALQFNATSASWCGGSLIAPNWVLTAAHCTYGIATVIIYLGATNRTSAELIYHLDRDSIIIHNSYKREILQNDISLVRIPTTKYTNRIQPIKLPIINRTTSLTYLSERVIATGWGRINDNVNKVTQHLQYAQFEIVSNEVCAKVYGSSVIYPTNICIATTNGISTCNGDSGGPLVLPPMAVQVGLVSFGADAGCEKNFPIVLTRLTNYLQWIELHTNISYRE